MTDDDANALQAARDKVICGVKRRVLTGEDLMRLKEARPRFEKDIRLPSDSRGRNKVWMFSIDGELEGNVVRGALLECEDGPGCMLVQARDFASAFALTKDGMRSTIELLQGRTPLVTVAANADLTVETGGARSRPFGELRSDPKLKDMIGHVIGGKPWKH